VIEIKQEDSRFCARQTIVSPSVYLDHWAVRKLSFDERLRTRFSEALRQKNGTLALSLINSIEFVGLQFSAEAEAADRLVDAISPHLFFLWVEPFTVIANEQQVAAGNRYLHPAADDDAMQRFVELGDSPLSGKCLFRVMVSRRDELLSSLQSLGRESLEGIERLRQRHDSDPEVRKRAASAPHRTDIHLRSTLPLMQVLLRRFLKNRGTKLSSNDGVDLLHAVVPASYCDFVLLDRRWEAAVEEARRELQRCGMNTPIAKVFSERNNGIERFLVQLERFDAY
jgi:hypothetical protein